jgi:hypothetical protein
MGASAAQAEKANFEADDYPAVAKGEQEGDENYFEITPHGNASKTECSTAVYNATLSEASDTLTVTPHYSGCSQTVRVNGCYFSFETSGTTVDGVTEGTADVVCPKDKNENKTTIEVVGPFGICEVHVEGEVHGADSGANQNLEGITFKNVANGDVTVEVDIKTQIDYIETYEDGNFVSNVLMEGFTDKETIPHPTTSGSQEHPPLTYVGGTATDIFVT